ncbi:hypothetical protein K502DRAFT_323395 [Neoconidiobolus thromboides FSU 785]|nr:hypothetical protein K502DRAFT_323395 [Neoconidiobolus thromboides FSU 785]
MTSNLKPKEAKLEILPDRSYKQHKSSPSTSIYSNCALEHINYFSFNHQILIKEITISNSFHSPLINFRCNSGAVPIITPYSDELLEFTVDPESNLPNTDALILKLNSDLDLQFRFYFDKDTIGVSGQEDEDWYLIHCNNSMELSSILQTINNDANCIVKVKILLMKMIEIKIIIYSRIKIFILLNWILKELLKVVILL